MVQSLCGLGSTVPLNRKPIAQFTFGRIEHISPTAAPMPNLALRPQSNENGPRTGVRGPFYLVAGAGFEPTTSGL